MGDDQDWRLRADVADAQALHDRLRGARHFQRDTEPLISRDVVLSADDGVLFAYANTRAAIDETRAAVEHTLAADGPAATLRISHWDDSLGDWRQIDPPPDGAEREREREAAEATAAAAERDARIVTRTIAVTSGKMVRNWFETTVADEAKELGIELSIVERPHLLNTQIAFTVTGPAGRVDELVGDITARAGRATLLEGAYLTPL